MSNEPPLDSSAQHEGSKDHSEEIVGKSAGTTAHPDAISHEKTSEAELTKPQAEDSQTSVDNPPSEPIRDGDSMVCAQLITIQHSEHYVSSVK